MKVPNPARRDADAQGTMSGHWIRGRMRRFPFGTFSSFNSLSFGGMTGPSAEREAPHATSSVAIGNCSMRAAWVGGHPAARRACKKVCEIGALLFAVVLAGCATETRGGMGMASPMAERAQAQLDLARGYLSEGNLPRARPAVKRALQLNPGLAEAHVLAAVMYEREEEVGLAERHYKAALELEPANPQALNNYGAFLYGQGRLREALGPLRLATGNTDYRLRAQAFENLGLTVLALGRRDDARVAFERALALGDNQPRSRLELAAILYAHQDYSAAERHYHRFLTQAAESPRSLCLGLRLGAVPGATGRSADHAARLRDQYPEAISACP